MGKRKSLLNRAWQNLSESERGLIFNQVMFAVGELGLRQAQATTRPPRRWLGLLGRPAHWGDRRRWHLIGGHPWRRREDAVTQ